MLPPRCSEVNRPCASWWPCPSGCWPCQCPPAVLRVPSKGGLQGCQHDPRARQHRVSKEILGLLLLPSRCQDSAGPSDTWGYSSLSGGSMRQSFRIPTRPRMMERVALGHGLLRIERSHLLLPDCRPSSGRKEKAPSDSRKTDYRRVPFPLPTAP